MHLEFRNYCISKVNFLIEITLCITAILSIELNADVKLPKGLGPLAIESSYSVVKGASIDINLMASSKQVKKIGVCNGLVLDGAGKICLYLAKNLLLLIMAHHQ